VKASVQMSRKITRKYLQSCVLCVFPVIVVHVIVYYMIPILWSSCLGVHV